MNARIGAHVSSADPVAEAQARETSVIQIFLGDPQSYKGPRFENAGGAAALRQEAAAAGVDIFVHAPYLINVVSPNNRIRIPGRKLLQQHMDAAAEIGAKGLIVHGGHVGKGATDEQLAAGFDSWRKAIEATDIKVPLLIENTAGGDGAMARRLEQIAHLWDAVGKATGNGQVGFCLDTCHAWAGGIDLASAVERILGITGRIDLVHANDSRDAFDSGADRHANFGEGHLPADEFVDVVRSAGAPVVCETPGGAEEHRRDIAWLSGRL